MEAGGIIGGALSLLTMAGGGIVWLFGRHDTEKQTREKKLQTWQDEIDAREKRLDQGRTEYTAKLESRLQLLEAKDEARDTQMTALRIAFELVSSALRQIDHSNSALALADDLLRSAFPVPAATPADMVEQLVAIEKTTGERG
ncbi:MAG: hypothetical protein V4618_13530 [Pseudomonadota bacterium]